MGKDNSGKRNSVLRGLERRSSTLFGRTVDTGVVGGEWPEVSLQSALGPRHGWDLGAMEGLKQESDRAWSASGEGGSGCSREWGAVDRQGNCFFFGRVAQLVGS